jgi:Ca2+-binding EF-hand superfamily protein
LKGAFELFDKNKDGSISAVEIKAVLGVGKKFGNEQIFDDIIKEVDVNGDGVITYDEFKVMMRKFLDSEIESNPGSFNQSGRSWILS